MTETKCLRLWGVFVIWYYPTWLISFLHRCDKAARSDIWFSPVKVSRGVLWPVKAWSTMTGTVSTFHLTVKLIFIKLGLMWINVRSSYSQSPPWLDGIQTPVLTVASSTLYTTELSSYPYLRPVPLRRQVIKPPCRCIVTRWHTITLPCCHGRTVLLSQSHRHTVTVTLLPDVWTPW